MDKNYIELSKAISKGIKDGLKDVKSNMVPNLDAVSDDTIKRYARMIKNHCSRQLDCCGCALDEMGCNSFSYPEEWEV